MRHLTRIAPKTRPLTATAALPVSALAGEPPKATRATEEAAIVKLMADQTAAWNKHDPKARAQLFSEDATLIGPTGRAVKGKAALFAMFAAPGPTETSTFKLTVDSIQWLATEAALVDGTQEIVGMLGPDGKPMAPVTVHVTAVVQKVGAAWLLTAVRPYQFITSSPPASAQPATN